MEYREDLEYYWIDGPAYEEITASLLTFSSVSTSSKSS